MTVDTLSLPDLSPTATRGNELAAPGTNVPRDDPYTLDVAVMSGARRAIVVAFGSEAAAHSERFVRSGQIPGTRHTYTADAATAEALERLTGLVDSCLVGTRLVLIGAEADVYAGRRCARDAGMVDAEIALVVLPSRRRRVYCAHCRTVTTTTQPIDGVAPCAACGDSLLLYGHFSRVHAAYLGFKVDAEEPLRESA